MREEISSLLSCLDLEDFREKNAAVSDLAMLLEKNTYILSGGHADSRLNEYGQFLPEELLTVTLSIEEQEEIVADLTQRIRSGGPLSSSMLWAIGKASPEVGLSALTEILKCDVVALDDKMSYQFLIALDNFVISFTEAGPLSLEKEFIRFLENHSRSRNQRLAESDERVLRKIK